MQDDLLPFHPMNHYFLTHLICVWALLAPTGNVSGQTTDPSLEALTGSPWTWIRPDNKTTGAVMFDTNGRVVQDTPGNKWQGTWTQTGPLTVVITHDKKYKWTLQFSADWKTYTGRSGRRKSPVLGNRINPLPAVDAESTSAPAIATPERLRMVQTDSTLSRIEVIRQQGPNAAEWAFTPLDRPIPADIRQNLTYLREDLLDEAAKAPKSSTAAYTQASDYCDKLLAAFSQREIARLQAGYRATQADANQATSTQALDAHRNHQMSWPQFSREESQRAALRESEADKANVKKQRLKVEWTTRATQMRTFLDNLYRQLREAMR
ncbi:MAG: hypothetical protein R3F13_07680 [Prosthecobacter sp.]